MKVTLMFPTQQLLEINGWAGFEELAYFAARRARSMKTHNELWDEVAQADTAKTTRFLRAILHEEWSLDVADMNIFIYDLEGVPSWLMVEFLRHRLIARDWSFEQRSKRAIHGERIPVINPFDRDTEAVWHHWMAALIDKSHRLMADAHAAGIPAEKLRYACLEGSETAFVAAANARALHHLFTMRGSTDIGGDGRAAPEFMEVVDEMYRQAKDVCPLLFERVRAS